MRAWRVRGACVTGASVARVRGVAWRGVAWRGVAWRGVTAGSWLVGLLAAGCWHQKGRKTSALGAPKWVLKMEGKIAES